jgi:sulfide dehydrogenase [flavocytochrome c] flavoprotein subunit
MRLNFVGGGFETAHVINLVPPQRAGSIITAGGLNTSADGRWAPVDVRSFEHRKYPGIHVLGDSVLNGGGRTGHIANQQAKIFADALVRNLAGQPVDPAPTLSGAAYSALSFSTASWVMSSQAYDAATGAFVTVPGGTGEAAVGSDGDDHFEDLGDWYGALMGDTFA